MGACERDRVTYRGYYGYTAALRRHLEAEIELPFHLDTKFLHEMMCGTGPGPGAGANAGKPFRMLPKPKLSPVVIEPDYEYVLILPCRSMSDSSIFPTEPSTAPTGQSLRQSAPADTVARILSESV